ncbi:MAG: hypothetical protein HY578_10285 [Nitrospinae bacterium]|nr:hypothetical protein [Nitrospinota bacterium]
MIQRIIIGIGIVVFIVGSALQGKYITQGYTKFIAGEGYITFMSGLIIIILGFAFNLLTGEIHNGKGKNSQ